MWFYIRMMTISWVDQIANEEVLQRAGTERKIMNTIRKRQLEFSALVMRKEGLEEPILTGRINGTRSRGRRPWTYLESLSKWMPKQKYETSSKTEVARLKILRTAKDMELWRSMVANISREYGT